MRDRLIGYVLGALDPAEHEEVECQLQQDCGLREELDVARQALVPLECDRNHHDPPFGLAATTCRRVAAVRTQKVTGGFAPAPVGQAAPSLLGGGFVDFVVAAGIVLAAGMLFVPAISHSRLNAQLVNCQNNLAEIGRGLSRYSQRDPAEEFPSPIVGNLAAAGLYAPTLLEKGDVSDPKLFFCGGAESCGREPVAIPTMNDLRTANSDDLKELLARAGGSYGYTLGYMNDGVYHPTRNRGRSNFPIMADAPCPRLHFEQSSNHGGYGQNVLFEDGHVRYLTSSRQSPACPDLDFFRNDDGEIAAGKHPDDAVIGCSSARPRP